MKVRSMNFVFIANDLGYGSDALRAEDILDCLLASDVWAYTRRTPHVSRIGEGDRVIVYAAGANRRFFCASFTIAGRPSATRPALLGEARDRLMSLFSLWTPIRDTERWGIPVPMSEVKDVLAFITDKKNWGLHIRQSVREIDDGDYNLIQEHRLRLNG